MIPLAEARATVVAGCTRLEAVLLPISEALGCVATEPLVAHELVPPFANTAVDGFAVRAADTAGLGPDRPRRFDVIATIAAGMGTDLEPGPGEAVRIMTGAPMPRGADAVVMVEDSRAVADPSAPDRTIVELSAEVVPGRHVRPAGDDLGPGDVVYGVGEVLRAGHLGVLATLGRGEVSVVPRARVGVMSTGDELVTGGRPLLPGQIRDSNRTTLLALVEQAGCEAVDLGCVADDEGAIEAGLGRGVADCDAIVTSGGVSMGDFDLVKVVLDRIATMRWMQVAIKPAKPLAFGTVPGPAGRTVPVFGLPGNPVSSVVSFELFARPGLRKMMGHADSALDRPTVKAEADDGFVRHRDGKVHFARVWCSYDDGRYHVRIAGGQGSHHLSALVRANALAVIPDGSGVPAGGVVDVLLTGQ